jgi:hypothetical protein
MLTDDKHQVLARSVVRSATRSETNYRIKFNPVIESLIDEEYFERRTARNKGGKHPLHMQLLHTTLTNPLTPSLSMTTTVTLLLKTLTARITMQMTMRTTQVMRVTLLTIMTRTLSTMRTMRAWPRKTGCHRMTTATTLQP